MLDVTSVATGDKIGIEYFLRRPNGTFDVVRLGTSDEGKHWTRSSVTARETMKMKRFGSRIYKWGSDSEFVRSEDNGNHWERPQLRIGGKPTRENANLRFIFSTVAPQQPTTIYGCFESLDTREGGQPPAPAGLYISFDAGDNWSLLTNQVQSTQLDERCPLGISPSNPDVMIAHGQNGPIISRDSGKHWETVGGAVDLQKPAVLKGYSENLAALKQKGVSVTKQWPFEWTYLIIAKIEFLPSDQNTAFLITNKGVYKTADGGRRWCLLDTGPRKLFDVRSIYFDPVHRGRIYIGTNMTILKSDDVGCHFKTFFNWENYRPENRESLE